MGPVAIGSPGSDPILWWHNHGCDYPYLARLAAKLFVTPPTSVQSERTFSIAGRLFVSSRPLSSAVGEKVLFINSNMALSARSAMGPRAYSGDIGDEGEVESDVEAIKDVVDLDNGSDVEVIEVESEL